MKHFFLFILGMFCFGSVFADTGSVDPMYLPKITQYVTDFSQTLSPIKKVELGLLAESFYKKTNKQLLSLIVPSKSGYDLYNIGLKSFSENGISNQKNNRLLLLISSEDKQIEFVVGDYLKGYFSGLVLQSLIEDDIRPLVNRGDIEGAIRVFYKKSMDILSNQEEIESSQKEKIFMPSFFARQGMSFLYWGSTLLFISLVSFWIRSLGRKNIK